VGVELTSQVDLSQGVRPGSERIHRVLGDVCGIRLMNGIEIVDPDLVHRHEI
jgi:hypothetical protein